MGHPIVFPALKIAKIRGIFMPQDTQKRESDAAAFNEVEIDEFTCCL
jgi:hypothetical protein